MRPNLFLTRETPTVQLPHNQKQNKLAGPGFAHRRGFDIFKFVRRRVNWVKYGATKEFVRLLGP